MNYTCDRPYSAFHGEHSCTDVTEKKNAVKCATFGEEEEKGLDLHNYLTIVALRQTTKFLD